MMRSMYTGVTGLRTHQEKMDTIGNNIANVNTTGFKRGQVTFKDTFSQTLTGASAPTSGRGGVNPMQVGMGVTTSNIKTVHTIGAGQQTGDPLDLMLEGEGFFTVSDDSSFNNRYYTRNGNFMTDAEGNLVTADGMKVLGYAMTEGEIDSSTVRGLRINQSDTVPAASTKLIEFVGNLDSNTVLNSPQTIDTNIYDSLGNQYKVSFDVTKTEENKWTIKLNRVTDMASGNYVEKGSDGMPSLDEINLEFDKNGSLIDNSKENLDEKVIDFSNLAFNKDKNGDNIGPIKPSGQFGTVSGNAEEVKLFDTEELDKITQYANDTNFKPNRGKGDDSGRPAGNLTGFSVGGDGIITGVFSNGQRRPLGQLMITKFDNPMGLEKIGNTMFLESRNSGEPQYGIAGSGGIGGIRGGTLEMSNVDISFEFTEMITTQRGFQANSRIITTSDEMLQELVNIKR